MKTKSNNVRLLFATAAFGVLAVFVFAGPPPGGWQGTKQIKSFAEAKGKESFIVMCTRKGNIKKT